jgi:protein-tyrosine phosphatase
MESLVRTQGLGDRFAIDSAGTAGYHIGRSPDARMLASAQKRGYLLESRAKQFEKTHLRTRTLILAMDRENLRDVLSLAEGVPTHVKLFSDFLDAAWPRDVPDPYYGGEEGFEYVLDMLEAGCPRILDELLKKF